jgi:hypothetical protein
MPLHVMEQPPRFFALAYRASESYIGSGRLNELGSWITYIYLTTRTSLSPIWHGFVPGFVNYKKGCTRLAAASDKVYQLLAHGLWFSPASSTTKTGRHDIAEILLKVALNTINPTNQSILIIYSFTSVIIYMYCRFSSLTTTPSTHS